MQKSWGRGLTQTHLCWFVCKSTQMKEQWNLALQLGGFFLPINEKADGKCWNFLYHSSGNSTNGYFLINIMLKSSSAYNVISTENLAVSCFRSDFIISSTPLKSRLRVYAAVSKPRNSERQTTYWEADENKQIILTPQRGKHLCIVLFTFSLFTAFFYFSPPLSFASKTIFKNIDIMAQGVFLKTAHILMVFCVLLSH